MRRIVYLGKLGSTALAALWLSACLQTMAHPDLRRLYRAADGATTVPPVIVLHGVLGARLRDTRDGREVWPGSLTRLLFSDYRDLALPIDAAAQMPARDTLEPSGIFDRAAGHDFYGAILSTLEQAGGYRRSEPGAPADGGRRYYVFLYDWRRDNVENAKKLDAFIESVRRDYRDSDLKVDLIAHSNGGLIARYYLRYGGVDVLDGNDFPVSEAGAAKVRRLVLLGTPNFGSLRVLIGLIEGQELGFRRIPPEVLATMPTAYQLLPHALSDWLVTASGSVLDRDLFDVDVWRRFEWSIFDPKVRARILAAHAVQGDGPEYLERLERYFANQLERARRFTWSLTVPEPASAVRPIVFGGDCVLTPARGVVEEINGDSVLRLWPKQIKHPQPGIDYQALMLEPGDGAVTKASLLARESLNPSVPRHAYSAFPLEYAFFLCTRHEDLTGDPSFQDNMLQALLSVDMR